MSKKFSKIFSGITATSANGSHINDFLFTLQPSRTNSSAQTAIYSAEFIKNSAIFAGLVINSFMLAKTFSAGVAFSVSMVMSKKLPNVAQEIITNAGKTYFAMSAQHLFL